jgi:outer membrane protein TolC
MSCDPAGAVIFSAIQRIECFCRTRILSWPMRHQCAVFLGALALASSAGAGSETATTSSSAPRFTLRQAVERAFQHNPAVLTARQEIRRTKGVQIQVRAEAIPHLDASGMFNHIAPSLRAGTESAFSLSDNSYNVSLTGSQLIYNGSVIPAIKGAAAATDASLYSLRNTIDQVIATVREQFYLVILNRALIGVQEESVHLLEAQLKDQQNRFEAGTVPRFNVLQAEVALANQLPALITARNNYRIAQLQLAKTIGLDFNPKRGDQPPLECVGELAFTPREMPLTTAIELGKERRPALKQQRANILVQVQGLRGAYAGIQPNLSFSGGRTWESSQISPDLSNGVAGWFWGVTGSWPIFDGLQTVGTVKSARATLSQAKIAYDDLVLQVELEIQQAYSNLQQDRQLYESQSKNVETAYEALRLATARFGVGAGVQLDVLNAQVALTQAQSTRLSALYSYNADLAEFDRATATDTNYHYDFDDPLTHTRSETRMTTTTATAPPKATPSPK